MARPVGGAKLDVIEFRLGVHIGPPGARSREGDVVSEKAAPGGDLSQPARKEFGRVGQTHESCSLRVAAMPVPGADGAHARLALGGVVVKRHVGTAGDALSARKDVLPFAFGKFGQTRTRLAGLRDPRRPAEREPKRSRARPRLGCTDIGADIGVSNMAVSPLSRRASSPRGGVASGVTWLTSTVYAGSLLIGPTNVCRVYPYETRLITMLDTDQLRSFLAIVDTGSFTRAAGARHKTQSAVSMHIRRLEEQLGCALFVKQGRGAKLTSDGEQLIDYARRIMQAEAGAMAALRARGSRARCGSASPTTTPRRSSPTS